LIRRGRCISVDTTGKVRLKGQTTQAEKKERHTVFIRKTRGQQSSVGDTNHTDLLISISEGDNVCERAGKRQVNVVVLEVSGLNEAGFKASRSS